MKKEQFKKIYKIHTELKKISNVMLDEGFLDEHGFIHFNKLKEILNELYKEFEDYDNLLLECLDKIVDNGYTTFNLGRLTKRELDEYSQELDVKKYPHAIINFKNLDEAIDYILN